MPYDVHMRLPGGNVAILRMAGRRPPRCLCGAESTRLCDWKMAARSLARGKAVTCDVPLCDSCTWSPAPDKDLCPSHAAEWKASNEAKS